MKKIFISSIACILILSGCARQTEQNEKVTIVLDWTPNTNHVGLYVAEALGYFAEYGIDVEIIQPNQTSSLQVVAANQAQLGISYQEDVTLARSLDNPLDVKAVAAILQHNTAGYASAKSANIQTPKDFENKIYGMYGSPIEEKMLQEIMTRAGADFSKLEMVLTSDSDFFKLVPDTIDFSLVYEGWTVTQANIEGFDIDFMPLRDLDETFDYYTPIIITNPQFEKNPELLKNTLDAIAKGYMFATNEPQQAADILLEAVPTLDRELVEQSILFLNEYYLDENKQFGKMKKSVWENYGNWLYEYQALDNPFNASEAFTNEYLPE